ncbi:hypothetical protein ACEWY4_004965 [Coilia grayii]|uniref:Exocyst complex component Sec3 PIP2-binding N-terminal domain-containing protein n=1 Tax=Coilia grayii TaxID=363190 RepID=A0ABD1KGY9_9TELE
MITKELAALTEGTTDGPRVIRTVEVESASKTKKKPCHVSITKVKKFEGSSAFVRRSQWSIDQLRQVNGIDPNRDSAEFDLTFDTALDQWVASSAGEKGIFVQVLHTTCQQHCSERKPEFVNCQAHLLRGDTHTHTSHTCSEVTQHTHTSHTPAQR